MGEDAEVGGGAEVWSQASQLCSGLVNKSWHANCVCTQAQTQTKYACVLWRGGGFPPSGPLARTGSALDGTVLGFWFCD